MIVHVILQSLSVLGSSNAFRCPTHSRTMRNIFVRFAILALLFALESPPLAIVIRSHTSSSDVEKAKEGTKLNGSKLYTELSIDKC